MKTTINFLVLLFGLLLANAANAESPREQLKQMVEQLQQTPDDNALREKIIKLAPSLMPSPALPDAAITFEGRARFAFGHAESEGDYLAAAMEYEKAVAAAPWVPDLYSDLCMAYEKAGKFEDAKRHCGFYLTGLTDPAEITDVKGRIAGLEFGIEKTNLPQAREATLLEKVEGARFVYNNTSLIAAGVHFAYIYEIRGGMLYSSIQIYAMPQGATLCGSTQIGLHSTGKASYRDGVFTLIDCDGDTHVHRIRSDGQALITTNPNFPDTVAIRQ